MLVTFKLNGEVDKIDVVSGPKMLQAAASDYVQGWHANEYTGPRTCPIAVRFVMFRQGAKAVPFVVRQDVQHVTVNAPASLIQPSYSASAAEIPRN